MDTLLRFFLISSALIAVSCTGGGGESAPTITSFTSSSSAVAAGSSVDLTAVFTGGTGSIDNGVGSVSSGVAKSATVTADTTYTLTVTNPAGSVTSSVTVVTAKTVNISWLKNPETAVNRSGGGYKVYYSSTSGFNITDAGVTEVDVPYVSGASAPISKLVQFPPGTYYIRVVAYSGLNAPGTTGGSTSTVSPQTTLVVS